MALALEAARGRDMTSLDRTRLWLAIYLFVACAYIAPGATWHPVSRFLLTRAIVEHHTLEITPYADATGDRAQVGERFYTDKAPVPSLFAVPAYAAFYAVAKLRHHTPAFESEGTPERPAQRVKVSPAFRHGLWISSASTSAVAGALIGLALFELSRRRVAMGAALSASIVSVLGTPIYPYATSFFGHVLAGAFLIGAVALLDRARTPDNSFDEPPPARVIAAGAALALSIGCEYIAAVPALILAGYFVASSPAVERFRIASRLALGMVLPVALIGAYHTRCFGAPWTTGYSFVLRPTFARGHARGLLGVSHPTLEALWGITFGRSRGLFYVAPICALALLGLVIGWRRARDRLFLIAALVVVSLVWINASYYMWNGGYATGPRHVVPALPFLGLGLGAIFSSSRGARVAGFALSFASVFVMVLSTAVALESPPGQDAVFDYLVPAIHEGNIARVSGASNLGLAFGLSRRVSVVPLVFWIGLGAFLLTARSASSAGPALSDADEPMVKFTIAERASRAKKHSHSATTEKAKKA